MDYQKASNYWKNKVDKVAPEELIVSTISGLLGNFRHCTLATASDLGVDATPVHYVYVDDFVYIFSEGGEKFTHLEKNKNVCVSIYNSDGDFGNIHSVQLYGESTFVDVMNDEYMKVVENSVYKLNKDYLKNRAEKGEPLYLIKIIPERFKITDSDFKKNGFDINQVFEV